MSKDEDLDLGEMDLDSTDFDLYGDDLFSESTTPKNNREAIMSIASKASSGAIDAIGGEGRRRQLILKALPEDYTSAFEALDEMLPDARQIVRDTKDQIIRTEYEIKRTARNSMPMLRRYLPERFTKRIEAWTKMDEAPTYGGKYDPNEAQISSEIEKLSYNTNRFSSSEEQDSATEEKVRSLIKDQMNTVREEYMYSALIGIRNNTSEMLGYEKTFATNYRRKMIELQYRQFFVLTDMLEHQRQSMDKIIPAAEAIVHNTALPDYAKEEFSEITAAQMKRKIIETFGPANWDKNYYKVLAANTRAAISEFFGGINLSISTLGMQAGMDAMMEDERDLSSLSPKQRAMIAAESNASKAGQYIARKFLGKPISKAQSWLRSKGENNETIRRYGRKLRYYTSNARETINTYANDPSYDAANDTERRFMQSVIGTVGDIFQGIVREDVNIDNLGGERIHSVAPWTKRSDNTLNVIIPSILNKIDQSVRRIYEPNAKLERFDLATQSFVDDTEILNRIRRTVNDKETREWMRGRIDDTIKDIENAAGMQLSDKDRTLLGRTIDEKIRTMGRFNINDLASSYDAYGTTAMLNDVNGLMNIFSRISFDEDVADELNIKIGDRLRDIRSGMRSTQDTIDELSSIYGQDALVKAGIFKKDGDRLVPNKDLFNTYADISEYQDDSDDNLGGDGIRGDRINNFNIDINYDKLTDVITTGVSNALTNTNHNRNHRQFQFDTTALEDAIEHLANSQTDSLSKIEQLLANRTSTRLPINDDATPTDTDSEDTNVVRSDGQIFRRVLLRGVSKPVMWAGKGAWKTAKWTSGKFYNGVGWTGRKIFNNIGTTMRGTRNTIHATSAGIVDGIRGYRDIYDRNTGNIVLRGKKIKQGLYFNKDGNVIKSIKDLKGGVYNSDGTLVLSETELREMDLGYFSRKGLWNKLLSGSTYHAISASRATINAVKIPFNISDIASREAIKMTRRIRAPGNVYVKGEPHPRLRYDLMVNGFYVSANTGRIISSISDIDGAVKTINGDDVITSEELTRPDFELVDVKGEPIKSLRGRIIGRVTKTGRQLGTAMSYLAGAGKVVGGYGISAAKWSGRKIADGATAFAKLLDNATTMMLDNASDIGHNFINALNRYRGRESIYGERSYYNHRTSNTDGLADDVVVSASHHNDSPVSKDKRRQIDILRDIYHLLDTRLPNQKSNKFDNDGDGDIDGSAKDIWQKRAEMRKESEIKEANKRHNSKVTNVDKKDSGWLGVILGALGAAATSISSILSGGFNAVSKALTLIAASKTADSVLDTATDVGGRGKKGGLLRRAGRGLWNGTKAIAKGSSALFKGGATVASFLGRQVLWQGLRTAGVWALGAAGAIISAPAALGIMAATAVGYGAYKLATGKDNNRIDQIRFAMYGIEDYESGSSDDVAKVRLAEDKISKFTRFDKTTGYATISKLDNSVIQEIGEAFNVDPDNYDDLFRFKAWFGQRFIPIYLLWQQRLNENAPSVLLVDAGTDKTTSAQKRMLLDKVKLPATHPVFRINVGPFDEPKLIGPDVSMTMLNEYIEHLDKLIESEKSAIAKADKLAIKEHMSKTEVSSTNTSNDQGYATYAKMMVDGKIPTYRNQTNNVVYINELKSKSDISKSGYSDAAKFAASAGVDTVTLPAAKFAKEPDSINSLQAIRYRAYGLSELSLKYVSPIQELEHIVLKHLQVNRAGNIYTGDTEKIAKYIMPRFGYNPDNINEFGIWTSWFNLRFLPIFSSYASCVYQLLPNANILDIMISSTNGKELFSIAARISSVLSTYKGESVSVWNIPYPAYGFTDFKMNFDIGTINGNMKYLQQLVKEKPLIEQTYREKPNKIQISKKTNNPVRQTRAIGSSVDVANQMLNDLTGDTFGGYDNSYGAGLAANDDVLYDPNNLGIKVREMFEPTNPNGTYAKIQLKSKRRDDVANMIKQVAKATGVDENIMLAIAMMESSLDTDAGVGTSSAKGLYQFIDKTWNLQLKKYANKYGIPTNASQYDPVANALLGAEYIRQGDKAVKSAVNRNANPVDIYMSHFMGPAGMTSFLRKMKQSPNRPAAADFKRAAKANFSIFYDSNGQPRSYAQVYDLMARKVKKNFNWVSKYATKPHLAEPITPESAIEVSNKNSSDSPMPASPEALENVTIASAAQGIKNTNAISNDSKINEVVPKKPTSDNSTSNNVDISNSDVATTTDKVVDKKIDIDKAREHVEKNRRDNIKARNKRERQRELDDKRILESNTKAVESSESVQIQQLNVQQQMLHVLQSIDAKIVSSSNTTQAVKQTASQVTKAIGPTIEHKPNSLNVSRSRR